MGKSVVLAGLFHETNTFLAGATRLEHCDVFRGDQILQMAGDHSPMAGVLRVAGPLGWDLLPSVFVRAPPGPIADNAIVATVRRGLENVLSARDDVDGVLLVLHGAMVAQSDDDVEGTLIKDVRRFTRAPLCGVLDLHANASPAMTAADCLVAYHENPHSDAERAGARAARLLDRLMTERRPGRCVIEQTRILWPPTATRTADEPLCTLQTMARRIEEHTPEILAVNVLPGFAFADTANTGVSFLASTLGDPGKAGRELLALRDYAHEHRAEGLCELLSIAEAVSIAARPHERPIVLAEPADNIGAGAPGDLTELLRAVIDADLSGVGAVIADATAIRALEALGLGSRTSLTLGSRDRRFGPPLTIEVELVSRSDGRFTLEDPNSHLASMQGRSVDMGRCAVVRHRGVTILLTSQRTPPFDLGQWRSQGIDPASFSTILVKAAVGHRRAYDPIAQHNHLVNTKGPCTEDLRDLHYRKIRRPMFPLDPR